MVTSHISLYVSDIDTTAAFYDRFLQQAAAKRAPGYAKYELSEPGLVLSFVQRPELVAPATGHFGLRVDTEAQLRDLETYAETQGLVAFREENVSCCYAKQDKFWIQDPDGYRWEIYYFHEDVAFNDPEYDLTQKESATGAKTCC